MKKMTELEHFVRKENVDADGKICAIARVIERKRNDICEHERCSSCNYYKDKNHILEVLLRKYKEPIKVTDDEKVILKNLPKEYKWIARDEDNELNIYVNEPIKNDNEWLTSKKFFKLTLFDHLFMFIKWEDEEPYSIEELLDEEE